MTYIGIIGGSGLYSIMETRKTMDVDTPYGKPSAPLEIGEINGVEVAFCQGTGKSIQYPLTWLITKQIFLPFIRLALRESWTLYAEVCTIFMYWK